MLKYFRIWFQFRGDFRIESLNFFILRFYLPLRCKQCRLRKPTFKTRFLKFQKNNVPHLFFYWLPIPLKATRGHDKKLRWLRSVSMIVFKLKNRRVYLQILEPWHKKNHEKSREKRLWQYRYCTFVYNIFDSGVSLTPGSQTPRRERAAPESRMLQLALTPKQNRSWKGPF